MKIYELNNKNIRIQVKSMGAELVSLQDIATGKEYMWNADAAYWGRTAPILFPIVGGLKNKRYCYQGTTYEMSQHGFARDMEFTLETQTEDTLSLSIESTEETLSIYPFRFRLEIIFQLTEKSIKVTWRVINQDTGTMYFSIGGHPGFVCPIEEGTEQAQYALSFVKDGNAPDQINITPISDDEGLALCERVIVQLTNGNLPITEGLFAHDALVLEDSQADQVSLITPQGRPYVTVTFDSPLVGIWSPMKPSPFICIEPWYGRCDAQGFTGELQDREWGNTLESEQIFERCYTISID